MFESILEKVLNKFLAPYVEGITSDHLKLGVWSGNISLSSLKVKPEITDILDLPLEVEHGQIDSIEIKIPWRALYTKPVVISIRTVHLFVSQRQFEQKAEQDILNKLQAAKLSQVELREQQYVNVLEAQKQQGGENGGADASPGWGLRLLNKIVNNIQIDVTDVHVAFADKQRGFTIGLMQQTLSLHSTDRFWNKAIESAEEEPAKAESVTALYKEAGIEGLGVYVQTYAPSSAAQASPQLDAGASPSLESEGGACSYHYLLKPLHLRLRVHHDPKDKELQARLEIGKEAQGIAISRDQFITILDVAQDASIQKSKERRLLLRDAPTVRLDPDGIRTETRDEFVSLYTKHINYELSLAGSVALSEGEKRRLQTLHNVVGVRHLAKWRAQCREKAERILEGTKQKEKAAVAEQKANRTWWQWARGAEASNASSASPTSEPVLTADEIKEITDAVEDVNNFEEVEIPTKYSLAFLLSNFSIELHDDARANQTQHMRGGRMSIKGGAPPAPLPPVAEEGTAQDAANAAADESRLLGLEVRGFSASVDLQSKVDRNDRDNTEWRFATTMTDFSIKHRKAPVVFFHEEEEIKDGAGSSAERVATDMRISHSIQPDGNLLSAQLRCQPAQFKIEPTVLVDLLSFFAVPQRAAKAVKELAEAEAPPPAPPPPPPVAEEKPLPPPIETVRDDSTAAPSLPRSEAPPSPAPAEEQEPAGPPPGPQLPPSEPPSPIAGGLTEAEEADIVQQIRNDLMEDFVEQGYDRFRQAATTATVPDRIALDISVAGPVLQVDTGGYGVVEGHLGTFQLKTNGPCAYEDVSVTMELFDTQIKCVRRDAKTGKVEEYTILRPVPVHVRLDLKKLEDVDLSLVLDDIFFEVGAEAVCILLAVPTSFSSALVIWQRQQEQEAQAKAKEEGAGGLDKPKALPAAPESAVADASDGLGLLPLGRQASREKRASSVTSVHLLSALKAQAMKESEKSDAGGVGGGSGGDSEGPPPTEGPSGTPEAHPERQITASFLVRHVGFALFQEERKEVLRVEANGASFKGQYNTKTEFFSAEVALEKAEVRDPFLDNRMLVTREQEEPEGEGEGEEGTEEDAEEADFVDAAEDLGASLLCRFQSKPVSSVFVKLAPIEVQWHSQSISNVVHVIDSLKTHIIEDFETTKSNFEASGALQISRKASNLIQRDVLPHFSREYTPRTSQQQQQQPGGMGGETPTPDLTLRTEWTKTDDISPDTERRIAEGLSLEAPLPPLESEKSAAEAAKVTTKVEVVIDGAYVSFWRDKAVFSRMGLRDVRVAGEMLSEGDSRYSVSIGGGVVDIHERCIVAPRRDEKEAVLMRFDVKCYGKREGVERPYTTCIKGDIFQVSVLYYQKDCSELLSYLSDGIINVVITKSAQAVKEVASHSYFLFAFNVECPLLHLPEDKALLTSSPMAGPDLKSFLDRRQETRRRIAAARDQPGAAEGGVSLLSPIPGIRRMNRSKRRVVMVLKRSVDLSDVGSYAVFDLGHLKVRNGYVYPSATPNIRVKRSADDWGHIKDGLGEREAGPHFALHLEMGGIQMNMKQPFSARASIDGGAGGGDEGEAAGKLLEKVDAKLELVTSDPMTISIDFSRFRMKLSRPQLTLLLDIVNENLTGRGYLPQPALTPAAEPPQPPEPTISRSHTTGAPIPGQRKDSLPREDEEHIHKARTVGSPGEAEKILAESRRRSSDAPPPLRVSVRVCIPAIDMETSFGRVTPLAAVNMTQLMVSCDVTLTAQSMAYQFGLFVQSFDIDDTRIDTRNVYKKLAECYHDDPVSTSASSPNHGDKRGDQDGGRSTSYVSDQDDSPSVSGSSATYIPRRARAGFGGSFMEPPNFDAMSISTDAPVVRPPGIRFVLSQGEERLAMEVVLENPTIYVLLVEMLDIAAWANSAWALCTMAMYPKPIVHVETEAETDTDEGRGPLPPVSPQAVQAGDITPPDRDVLDIEIPPPSKETSVEVIVRHGKFKVYTDIANPSSPLIQGSTDLNVTISMKDQTVAIERIAFSNCSISRLEIQQDAPMGLQKKPPVPHSPTLMPPKPRVGPSHAVTATTDGRKRVDRGSTLFQTRSQVLLCENFQLLGWGTYISPPDHEAEVRLAFDVPVFLVRLSSRDLALVLAAISNIMADTPSVAPDLTQMKLAAYADAGPMPDTEAASSPLEGSPKVGQVIQADSGVSGRSTSGSKLEEAGGEGTAAAAKGMMVLVDVCVKGANCSLLDDLRPTVVPVVRLNVAIGSVRTVLDPSAMTVSLSDLATKIEYLNPRVGEWEPFLERSRINLVYKNYKNKPPPLDSVGRGTRPAAVPKSRCPPPIAAGGQDTKASGSSSSSSSSASKKAKDPWEGFNPKTLVKLGSPAPLWINVTPQLCQLMIWFVPYLLQNLTSTTVESKAEEETEDEEAKYARSAAFRWVNLTSRSYKAFPALEPSEGPTTGTQQQAAGAASSGGGGEGMEEKPENRDRIGFGMSLSLPPCVVEAPLDTLVAGGTSAEALRHTADRGKYLYISEAVPEEEVSKLQSTFPRVRRELIHRDLLLTRDPVQTQDNLLSGTVRDDLPLGLPWDSVIPQKLKGKAGLVPVPLSRNSCVCIPPSLVSPPASHTHTHTHTAGLSGEPQAPRPPPPLCEVLSPHPSFKLMMITTPIKVYNRSGMPLEFAFLDPQLRVVPFPALRERVAPLTLLSPTVNEAGEYREVNASPHWLLKMPESAQPPPPPPSSSGGKAAVTTRVVVPHGHFLTVPEECCLSAARAMMCFRPAALQGRPLRPGTELTGGAAFSELIDTERHAGRSSIKTSVIQYEKRTMYLSYHINVESKASPLPAEIKLITVHIYPALTLVNGTPTTLDVNLRQQPIRTNTTTTTSAAAPAQQRPINFNATLVPHSSFFVYEVSPAPQAPINMALRFSALDDAEWSKPIEDITDVPKDPVQEVLMPSKLQAPVELQVYRGPKALSGGASLALIDPRQHSVVISAPRWFVDRTGLGIQPTLGGRRLPDFNNIFLLGPSEKPQVELLLPERYWIRAGHGTKEPPRCVAEIPTLGGFSETAVSGAGQAFTFCLHADKVALNETAGAMSRIVTLVPLMLLSNELDGQLLVRQVHTHAPRHDVTIAVPAGETRPIYWSDEKQPLAFQIRPEKPDGCLWSGPIVASEETTGCTSLAVLNSEQGTPSVLAIEVSPDRGVKTVTVRPAEASPHAFVVVNRCPFLEGVVVMPFHPEMQQARGHGTSKATHLPPELEIFFQVKDRAVVGWTHPFTHTSRQVSLVLVIDSQTVAPKMPLVLNLKSVGFQPKRYEISDLQSMGIHERVWISTDKRGDLTIIEVRPKQRRRLQDIIREKNLMLASINAFTRGARSKSGEDREIAHTQQPHHQPHHPHHPQQQQQQHGHREDHTQTVDALAVADQPTGTTAAGRDAPAKPDIKDVSLQYEITLGQIGLSCVSDALREELLFAEMQQVTFVMCQKGENQRINFEISDIQIDSQLEASEKPVLLANRGLRGAEASGASSASAAVAEGVTEVVGTDGYCPFLSLFIDRGFASSQSDLVIQAAHLFVDNLEVEFDDWMLNGLSGFVTECLESIGGTSSTGFTKSEILSWNSKPIHDGYTPPPLPGVLTLEQLYVPKFTLFTWVSLALRRVDFLPDVIKLAIQMISFSGTLELKGAPICLEEENLANVRGSVNTFMTTFADKYNQKVLGCLLPILGHSSLLNVPKIPLELGKTTIGFAFTAAKDLLGETSNLVGQLTFDREYINKRQKELRSRRAQNVGEGFVNFGRNVGEGILSVTNIVTKPIEGAQREGLKGFVKGIGKGVMGTLVKPLDKVGQAFSSLAEGVSADLQKPLMGGQKARSERRRKPRMLWGELGAIREYSSEEAELRETLGLGLAKNILDCITVRKAQTSSATVVPTGGSTDFWGTTKGAQMEHLALLFYPKYLAYTDLGGGDADHTYASGTSYSTDRGPTARRRWQVKISDIADVRVSSHGVIIRVKSGTAYQIPCTSASLMRLLYSKISRVVEQQQGMAGWSYDD
ncbi:unnamed protein product [Vitrella brassicaformis CCMP3155]|uniref:CUE domain-containing protein n=4 Tax=Vitrella brassicaformis TaxID=1169539 RepID=A0A0G4EIG2_VITBC|nr:unnamed protein product [Vitrella brassicaformis CCMP3155]|eukprot:CEL96788.1 unnamed protein product [Vitrella brassicaformis CCMP3155]